MTQQITLITGGYGCIGAETAKWLLDNSSSEVVIGSRQVNDERTQRVFHGCDLDRLATVEVDVTNQPALQELMTRHQVNRVVHLAALQTPDCNAQRDLGLQINLAGTQNLIEAMKASQLPIERFVFASSIAVYGPRAAYPAGRVPMLSAPEPVNVYGAWKLAGEQISRIFFEETGVPTLCLRPGVLYGPGRDAGLTSTPTTAMKHLVLGQDYEIPFRSRQDYLFAPDVGAAFGNAVLEPYEDFGVFTLPSRTLTTAEIVTAMQQAAVSLGLGENCKITFGNEEVPFICDLEFQPFLDAFPSTPHTSVAVGVRQSLEVFLDQAGRGWLRP